MPALSNSAVAPASIVIGLLPPKMTNVPALTSIVPFCAVGSTAGPNASNSTFATANEPACFGSLPLLEIVVIFGPSASI